MINFFLHLSLVLLLFSRTIKSQSIKIQRSSDDNTITSLSNDVIDLTKFNWTLSSSSSSSFPEISIITKIPSDVISDLVKNDIIKDPYMDMNFLRYRHVWMGETNTIAATSDIEQRSRSWSYETLVDSINLFSNQYILCIEGIKMGASVYFNDIFLGNVTNQFHRYTFNLSKYTAESLARRHLSNAQEVNKLKIVFDPSINTFGRFMACSGGWDWAPYTKAFDSDLRRVFTFGITKPIYLLEENSLSISHVVPKVYYEGSDDEKLLEKIKNNFRVELDIYFFQALQTKASIVIQAEFLEREIILTYNNSTKISVILLAPKEKIELWWPNGYGYAKLYSLKVYLQDSSMKKKKSKVITKYIGFRTIALKTSTSSDKFSEGTGSFGMYIQINGIPIVARGANMIPMDQLEGRISHHSYTKLIQSIKASNMNMIRVWGGGSIYPNEFYHACDELGILLYHDFMFVDQEFHTPQVDYQTEVQFIVRELMSHVSIIIWSGCNECDTKVQASIYQDLFQFVTKEDDTRIVWPSSPSFYGWKLGVFTSNGKPMQSNQFTQFEILHSSEKQLEFHGPYNHGSSSYFQTVNCNLTNFDYDVKLPPKFIQSNDIGHLFPSIFISEFGMSTFSSYESMSSTLTTKSGIHGDAPSDTCLGYDCYGNNVMAQRNYPCDNHLVYYFGFTQKELDSSTEDGYKRQLYACSIATLLWLKSTIEEMRSQQIMGMLLWQVNEIWPTGGWGLVEYGSNSFREGQVLGGRWKPIMHYLKQHLFHDVIATCGYNGICYIRNDGLYNVQVRIQIEQWDLEKNKISLALDKTLDLVGIVNSTIQERNIHWFYISSIQQEKEVLFMSVLDKNEEVMSQNLILYKPPKEFKGKLKNTNVILRDIAYDYQNNSAMLTLENLGIEEDGTSSNLALFIVLTTRAQGRFSENAFCMKPNEVKSIQFHSIKDWTIHNDETFLLHDSLRIEHLAMYL